MKPDPDQQANPWGGGQAALLGKALEVDVEPRGLAGLISWSHLVAPPGTAEAAREAEQGGGGAGRDPPIWQGATPHPPCEALHPQYCQCG